MTRRATHPATLKPPTYWTQATRALSAQDAVMAALIVRYPDAILANRGDPFQTLLRAIVGQQISVKAADSIWARFAALVGELTTQRVAELTPMRWPDAASRGARSSMCRTWRGTFLMGDSTPRAGRMKTTKQ